jgi:Bacterial SH3 domain
MRIRTLLLSAALVAAPPGGARAQATTGPAVFYGAPGSHELATVAQGTVLSPGDRSGEYVRVSLRGFVSRSLLGAARDSFAVSVSATDVRLRAAPNTSSAVIAALDQGMGLHLVKSTGSWAEVQRTGWVRGSAFPATLAANSAQQPARKARRDAVAQQPSAKQPSAAPAQAAPKADTTPADAPAPAGAVTPVKSGGLSAAPGLPPVASVQHGAVLVPLARERGWVRVRLEGWMRDSDLAAADSSMALITAADLQASPDQYIGRTVRWTVTALAFQTADPLRKDMKPNEPYLLARGPGDETSLLYLALPPDLVDRGKAIPPMTRLVITGRVRTGSSQPSGVPILDLLTMARQ